MSRTRRRKNNPLLVILALAWVPVIAVLAFTVAPSYVRSLHLESVHEEAPPAHPHYYDWNGRMPRGITLSGLQNYLINERVIDMMRSQISTAKYTWHANTIRLQILQDRLVGADGKRFDRQYFDYINTVVKYAEHLKLKVVLNAQTELSVGFDLAESEPTLATYRFWRAMGDIYGHDADVELDLFNEPRRIPWDVWKRGQQHLVDFVRARGYQNWLWVEGINWASTLENVPLLHDPLHRLIYSFHHPGAPWQYQTRVSVRQWDHTFGYLAAQGIPVVDGEFANYRGSYYWKPHPGKTVKLYLNYLESHHVGLLAWSLVPGSLNSDHRFASVTHEPQGCGQILMDWFKRLAREEV